MKSSTHILLGIALVAAAAFGQETVSGVLNEEKGEAYSVGASVVVVKVAPSPLFDPKTDTEPVPSPAVLQDLDLVIEEQDNTKGVSLKVGGIKVMEVDK